MHIAMGSDHAGFEYKERLKLFLIEAGHVVEDFGTDSEAPADYPLFVRPVAEAVAAGEFDRGVVLGGSGNGEAMVANRVSGVRCALCWNLRTARWAREHNDSNVLALGQRVLDFELARQIVEVWLETPFEGGRHKRRIRMIDRPPHQPRAALHNGQLPHRTLMTAATSYICDSCREEFEFPVDISAGSRQDLVEVCPICSHENVIHVEFDDEGRVRVAGHHDVTR
jgi:ribose 5-phosphate isomerase B